MGAKLTRTDLIEALAKDCKTEKKMAKTFLESFTTLVEKTMKKNGEVPLSGLGKFKVVKRKARMGRNPATGQTIKIPAKTVVKFTVAKNLKEIVKR